MYFLKYVVLNFSLKKSFIFIGNVISLLLLCYLWKNKILFKKY